jgi:hypothetical protein
MKTTIEIPDPLLMQGFGKLRRLRTETVRVQARIDEAFKVIEPGAAHS